MASMSAYSQPQPPTPTSPVQDSRCQRQLLHLQHMQMQMQMPVSAQMYSNSQQPSSTQSQNQSFPAQAQAQAQAQQKYLDCHSPQYNAQETPVSPVSPLSAYPLVSASALAPPPSPNALTPSFSQQKRKRKAESQDAPGNERLSKRLSLLNLERNGSKLYVPVEAPSPSSPCVTTLDAEANAAAGAANRRRCRPPSQDAGHMMQLDDSRHKVYIYNLDDELSSSESEPEDGRLIMLPDIKKHLLETRIPQSVKASPEGQLAGMQLVLYREPRALTVPEADDSVRKVVVEARQRIRDRIKQEAEAAATAAATSSNSGPMLTSSSSVASPQLPSSFATPSYNTPSFPQRQQQPSHVDPEPSTWQQLQQPALSSDAMDMDVDMDID